VTVIVALPVVPSVTVRFAAVTLKLPPLLTPPTATTAVPVEPAKVESPEYVATMVCDPAVFEEKLYVAAPFESARDAFVVVPSTAMLTVPVGVAVEDVESDDTVIVIASLAPAAGDAVAAVSTVFDVSRNEDEPVGQADSKLKKSIEPSPEALS
jgi:hypothetical protein